MMKNTQPQNIDGLKELQTPINVAVQLKMPANMLPAFTLDMSRETKIERPEQKGPVTEEMNFLSFLINRMC
jgi:hypothetical protein